MQTGLSSLLLEFSNTLVAFAAAAIYAFCRPRDLSGHPYFGAQRWTVSQALLFFFALDLAYKAASPLLTIRGSRLTEFAAWLAFQAVGPLWVWMFVRYLGQPLGTAGLAWPPAKGILQACRWLFGVVWVVAIAGAAAPPDTVAAAFRMEAHESGALYFMRLLVAASLAGLIEETGYRGILYGALRTRMAPVAAMVVTAAGFMLAHGEVNPFAFFMGLLCAWMVERYHSVLPGIIVHTGWDLFSGINLWGIGAMNLDPHGFFQTVALVTGAAFVAVWIMGKGWTNTPRDTPRDPSQRYP